jgi:AcrR family transcriptional regulator
MASTEPAKSRQPGGTTAGTIGLRARKKQKTREAIQRVALRLFERQGYEQTTIEQIAAAVEISPSTFFNYFPNKEDVVMLDIYDPMAIAMFKERPKDEPLNVSFRRVLEGLDLIFERDRELVLARGKLMMEVPELRARIWDELERTQTFVTVLLAERTGHKRDDFEVRVTARVVVAALYEASLEWFRQSGRKGLVVFANRALDVLESGAHLSTLTGPTSRRGRRTA